MKPRILPIGREFQLSGARQRASLSLAPLIDVTFILLIFFMLVTQFSHVAPLDVELGTIEPELTIPKITDASGTSALLRLSVG
ncbi:MAG: ExbD/TolR family protein, partial [Methyloligellaceae bacterium]